MIDLVYRTVQTILNKENNGYVSPTEFNILCNLVQMEIFKEYFSNENTDKIKENRGMTNKGYSNLDFNERQRITKFADIKTLTADSNKKFTIPTDLYFIEDDGITTSSGKVIEEVERSKIGYLRNSLSNDPNFPFYERYGTTLLVYPDNINNITVRYLRTPKKPYWTYTVVAGKEMFDPSNSSYQDFELHESEFSNIVIRLLSYFSINIREKDIIALAEQLKDKANIKENN